MVELSWSVPNVTNGILLYYTVVYINATHNFTMIYSSNTFSDTISGLNGNTFYTFGIYANTSAGFGPTANAIATTFEARE